MRINEIIQKQKVNIKCLISKCDKGKTVKDTPYLSLILEDATGVLDAKFWNLTNEQIEQYKVRLLRYLGIRSFIEMPFS